MRDCKLCGGEGWREWIESEDGSEPARWPDDTVLSGRIKYDDDWHPSMRHVGFCPVCPCIIEGFSPGEEQGTMYDPEALLDLVRYQLQVETYEEIALRRGFSENQVLIRLAWMASNLNMELKGAGTVESGGRFFQVFENL